MSRSIMRRWSRRLQASAGVICSTALGARRGYRWGMIRIALIALLLPAAPVWAQESPPRFVVAVGIEWSKFANAAPLDEAGQTTTGFELRDSGFDLTFAGEVAITEWLSAGVAHERLARIELAQSFDVDGFRNFSNELRDGVFDPSVTELYAAPSWSLGGSVRVTGMLGVGFWRASQSRTLVLLFEGDLLSLETLQEEHDGATLVVGAGIDIWPHRRFGLRAGYKYLRLSTAEIDEPVHNLRVLALFGF